MPNKRTNNFRANLVRSKAVPGWRGRKGTPEHNPKPGKYPKANELEPLWQRRAQEEASRERELKESARDYWKDVLGDF